MKTNVLSYTIYLSRAKHENSIFVTSSDVKVDVAILSRCIQLYNNFMHGLSFPIICNNLNTV